MEARKVSHYNIAWIAPLSFELAAAKVLLDDRHGAPDDFHQHEVDNNSCTWGGMGTHNLVLVSLSSTAKGPVQAAVTASSLVSLPHIRFGLLVGIGGRTPRPHLGRDIRLGGVVVSEPGQTTGGVVQYDLNTTAPKHTWERKRSLNSPHARLSSAMGNLKSEYELGNSRIPAMVQAMWAENPSMAKSSAKNSGCVHRGSKDDKLFDWTYHHIEGDNCERCDKSWKIERKDRESNHPVIHYGAIAPGNMAVKDAHTQDQISEIIGEKCLCVETEAAGDTFRGECRGCPCPRG